LKAFDPRDIERAIGGGLNARGRLEPVRRIVIDSRRVGPGDLFVAIVGSRHDGHDFAAEAIRRGAVGVVASRAPRSGEDGAWWVRVDDTTEALAALGAFARARFGGAVAAITGSSGKTTTKDLLARALGAGEGAAIASPSSFNNHIGVPLTLLGLEPDTRFAVIEVGSSAPGEIRRLAALVRPHVAIVTVIGESHLEGLRDRAGVFREKAALIESLPPSGVAVLSRDDAFFAALAARTRARIVSFGEEPGSTVRIARVCPRATGLDVGLVLGGRHPLDVGVGLLGRCNARNVAAAVAAARELGVDAEAIRSRLAGATGPPMRMERLAIGSLQVLNDAYNANPLSARAAVEALAGFAADGRRVAILGEMLELGSHAERCHRELLRFALDCGVHRVATVGARFRSVVESLELRDDRVVAFEDLDALEAVLDHEVRPGDCVLLKGSRGAGLERCLPHLERIGNATARSGSPLAAAGPSLAGASGETPS